ncbi:MAG: tetratricopeptide repeat protein [Myxococcales bacterium]|nr:tetratricopeptide repeat protein [Myxococcales bacterium]
MPNEKRLAMLEQLAKKEGADSFTFYALALEYQAFGRVQDAFEAFRNLRAKDPDYVPMYLMCGTMLLAAGRHGEGREWLESGILKAREKGDAHAQSELEDALEKVPPPPSLA